MTEENAKKLIMLIPYVIVGLLATHIGEAWRMSGDGESYEKILNFCNNLSVAFGHGLASLYDRIESEDDDNEFHKGRYDVIGDTSAGNIASYSSRVTPARSTKAIFRSAFDFRRLLLRRKILSEGRRPLCETAK